VPLRATAAFAAPILQRTARHLCHRNSTQPRVTSRALPRCHPSATAPGHPPLPNHPVPPRSR